MQEIRELMEVSAYRPIGSYAQELCQAAAQGTARQEVLAMWVGKGRSENSFYKAYKHLRDDLVRLAFLERKGTDTQGRRLDVLERWKVVQQLLILGKKMAAVSLGIDMVQSAIRSGSTDIVLGLASFLEGHFGAVEVDARRYLRYRKLRKDYEALHRKEQEVKALQALLAFSVEKRKPLKPLRDDIARLELQTTGTVQFMRYRFSVLSLWYQQQRDERSLTIAIRQTIQAYESASEVPAAWLINLFYRLTPILSRAGQYAEAEANIAKALRYAAPGSQNWHLLMLQRACVGFESGKLGLVRSVLKLASEAPREHENQDINRRWQVVEALLDAPGTDVWASVLG